MYQVVSHTRVHGTVVRHGLTLVEAYRLIGRLGHGAIFRDRASKYARPIYPRV